jgi:hypothetical protein
MMKWSINTYLFRVQKMEVYNLKYTNMHWKRQKHTLDLETISLNVNFNKTNLFLKIFAPFV